jgi:hypothetical protein
MKRLIFLCLFSCVVIEIVACSGTRTVTPVPTSTIQVTVLPSSGSPGASSPTNASSNTNETAVAMSYYQAVIAQNYHLAFTFLDANATGFDGQRLTWQAFLQLAQTMDNEGGPVINFSVAVSQFMIIMTINRQKIGPYHAHLQMKQEGNSWKIISIDRV